MCPNLEVKQKATKFGATRASASDNSIIHRSRQLRIGGLIVGKREVIVEKNDRAFSFGSFYFDLGVLCANSDGRLSLLAVVFDSNSDRFVFHG